MHGRVPGAAILDRRTDQRESAHWSRTLIAIASAGVGVATLFFLLRLYSRSKTVRRVTIEDVLLGVGLVFSYGLTACVIIAACNGVGYNIWALPRQTQSRVALVFFLGQKFWVLSHVFTKLSIIFLIRHLLSIVGPWSRVTTALIVFTIAWGITNLVGNTLQCLPPRYFWVRTIDGHCPDDQEAFSIVMGSLALAEDVVLLLIPIVIVWRMQMPRREKLTVTVLFGFGGVVCIFGILRVIELVHYQMENLTASGAFEVTWALLELNLGIICGCVMLMRPALRVWGEFFGRCWRGRTKSISSSTMSFLNFRKSWRGESWSESGDRL